MLAQKFVAARADDLAIPQQLRCPYADRRTSVGFEQPQSWRRPGDGY